MDPYRSKFIKIITAFLVASFPVTNHQVIQANEISLRISPSLDYSPKKAFIPQAMKGILSRKTLPCDASWLLETSKKAPTTPASDVALRIKKNRTTESAALKETLGVIPKKTKSDLIIITYFSRLCHQDPWDVGNNTRNRLMGLPACEPSQHYSILPLRLVRQRSLREQLGTPY